MRIAEAIAQVRRDAEAGVGSWHAIFKGTILEEHPVPQARDRQLALLDIANAVLNERSARRAFLVAASPKNGNLLTAWRVAGDATDAALQAFLELVEDRPRDSGRIKEGAA